VKAAVYHGAHDIRIEEVPEPVPAAGELLLEVHAAGICGTDVGEWVRGPVSYATRGHPVTGHTGPMIPGHELSGRVVAVGEDVQGFEPGAVVASGAGISCGACFQCRAGLTNLCVHYATVGLHRHGGLAQYCAVPAATCVDVNPYRLDEEVAALAQPMAIAVHSLRRGRPVPGEDVVILGGGGIGAFLSYAAVSAGARVTLVDVLPERLELARVLGAAVTLQPVAGVTLATALAERGIIPRVLYEVTGSRAVFAEAVEALPPGGRLVVVGLQAAEVPVDLRALTLREIELIGTNAHVCPVDLPEALRLLAARGDRWTNVAPQLLPLSELVASGIRPMAEGRSERVKTLIDPWASAARNR
jgi:(R,R)-butanediol dehydrogenase / meso-butanediol dehydrogenase / diacetyl reductase